MAAVLTRGGLMAAALLLGAGLALLLAGRGLARRIAGLAVLSAGAVLLPVAGGGRAGLTLALAGLILSAAGISLALALARQLARRYGARDLDELLALARKEEDE